MAIVDVELLEESQTRYLTYALSVVNNRALPDVRDGLKPVQRRILYAMAQQLHLTPDKQHRKSAAVVGEVLARFHPHGDSACYEALVRMAQDFSLRYPLIDGQGNFGSLDGDSAAAYRYTEARLRPIALEVVGEIGQETVSERDNFDQTIKEPIVLPSRVPNLLINGASGIAVGMATSIPPHNITEVVKALLVLIEEPETTISKLLSVIKGPDFPTGCSIVNSKAELKEVYTSGRGTIRMRADYSVENAQKGKRHLIVNSVPYGLDKSSIVEKIADLIIERKIPQLVDIRDESTEIVRIVLELAPNADPDKAMLYLYKNTPLQTNFNVNLTAIIPTPNPYSGKPMLLNLKDMLQHFIDFRLEVTRCKLTYERNKLSERIHLLEGIASIYDVLNEVIKIVRASDGRSDAAQQLQKRFKLSEAQAFFIVDLRIYQLSRTSIEEIQTELKEKRSRVAEIEAILKSARAMRAEIRKDLDRILEVYGDERRSKVIGEVDEPEFVAEEYIQHEDVFAIVSKDGWLKRIRQVNDPKTTRLREGDSLLFAGKGSTKDDLAIFTNIGNLFVTKINELSATTGFGEPVQKMFKFQDGEQIIAAMVVDKEQKGFAERELLFFTAQGYGFRMKADVLSETKRVGKRVARVSDGDRLAGVIPVDKPKLMLVSEEGYGIVFPVADVNLLTNAGKGVILQKIPDEDKLVVAVCVDKNSKVELSASTGGVREVSVKEVKEGSRAQRGNKIIKRGSITGIVVPEAKTEADSSESGQLELKL